MISLEEYKKNLIYCYRHECDNNIEMRKLREDKLNKIYSDEYLKKIIEDTYNVVRVILEEQPDYFMINMDDDTTTYIDLNLIGGFFSDRLFVDSDGNIISEYILKKVFGSQLAVVVMDEEYEYKNDDPDVVSFYYEYFLCLQDFPDNMKSIKKELFGKNKVKKR